MTIRRDATQAQLCLGVPGLPRDHPEAWTLEVLNAILGDGMSSRLFQSVREEKGLAYAVSSYVVDYVDAGALVVSAGVAPGTVATGVAPGVAAPANPAVSPARQRQTARIDPSALRGRNQRRGQERPAPVTGCPTRVRRSA